MLLSSAGILVAFATTPDLHSYSVHCQVYLLLTLCIFAFSLASAKALCPSVYPISYDYLEIFQSTDLSLLVIIKVSLVMALLYGDSPQELYIYCQSSFLSISEQMLPICQVYLENNCRESSVVGN